MLRSLAAGALVACSLLLNALSAAQSLDERLDEETFLRGVIELRLPDVLKAYVAAHPATDAFQAARFAVAAEQLTLADPSLPIAERLKGIDRIREIRAKLAAGADANDARVILVLADQGADSLFELLPIDGMGITALFGVPTAEQLRIAKWVANDVHSMARQAQQRIDQAIRAMESQPGYATDFVLQDQRRRLAEEQRDRRIPFLLGVGAILQAELNTTDCEQKKVLWDHANQKYRFA